MSPWPPGTARADYDTLDSTNDEARRRANAGETGPLWIAAAEQTAGRGRRGRDWSAPRGNLAATLLIRPERAFAEWAQLSFAAALAVSDALSVLAPGVTFALKWPNDVLANNEKIAGILLETVGPPAAPCLAIGIGVNIAHHPRDTPFPATSLAAQGTPAPDPAMALTRLAACFAPWYDAWRMNGFAPIRDSWLARAVGLGAHIRARLTDSEATGLFEGIDDTGALILRAPSGIRRIDAADIYFTRI